MAAFIRLVDYEGTLNVRITAMSSTKTLENRITARLLGKQKIASGRHATGLAETVIRGLSVVAVTVLVGAQLPELLWAGVAASTVYALGLE